MTHRSFVILLVMLYTLLELLSVILFAHKKKFKYLAESVFMYAVFAVFLYFEYEGVFSTPAFVLVLVIATIVAHTFLGECIDLYHKSKVFDRGLHLVGSFSFALFAYSIISHLLKPASLPALYVALFITSLGVALGTLFEIVEFIGDSSQKCAQPSQHGLIDTDTDLIANTIGAVLAGILSIYIVL